MRLRDSFDILDDRPIAGGSLIVGRAGGDRYAWVYRWSDEHSVGMRCFVSVFNRTMALLMVQRLQRFLVLAVFMLAATGCPVLSEDKVEEFPMLISIQISAESASQGELLEGRWTSATELRLGAADAATLGVAERIVLNAQERAPRISLALETGRLVNDINTNPEFCLEETVVLVDESQGSERRLAEAGECFQRDLRFEFHADIHPGE